MSKGKVKIEQLLADDSFVAWIEGNASPEQAAAWAEWATQNTAREQAVEKARSLHQKIAFNKNQHSDVEAQLRRLHETLGSDETSKTTKFKKRRYPSSYYKSNYRNVAAIIILIAVALAVIALFQPGFFQLVPVGKAVSPYQTASTKYGQQEELSLADGSTVILNGHSSLRYPSKTTGGDLEVWLKGEAYFDVVHKADRVLTIHVPGGVVKDLGTTFDVNTYKKKFTEVVLIKGQVKVEKNNTLSQHKDSYLMKPGELLHLPKHKGKITTRYIEPNAYAAWTRYKLIFKRASLAEVAMRIEHIYGVHVRFPNDQIKKILISGSLPNNGLHVFINALEKMLHRPVTNSHGVITIGR